MVSKKQLTGPEKSAVLLLSLSPPLVSKIFAHLEPEEIREISHRMANLGRVNSKLVEELYFEFADQVSSTGSLQGTIETTERLLKKVLSEEQTSTIVDEIQGPKGRTVWEKLTNVDEEVLGSYLRQEYPQTVAVVMSRINPEHAARVLGTFPEDFAMEVMQRMLKMDAVKPEIVHDIENTLRSEFMSNIMKSKKIDSHEQLAEIFNACDRSSEEKYLAALEKTFPDAAERVRSLMFTFDDLIKINFTGFQQLVGSVDKTNLALALKGADEDIRKRVYESMSKRAVKLLKEDMENLGMVKVRDVEDAQLDIIATAKDLIDKGDIYIPEESEDEEYIK